MLMALVRALRRRWQVWGALRRSAQDSQSRLSSLPLGRILVVCYGNIYRSPYLAEYLRDRLPARHEVRSAGFHARAGRSSPASHIEMSALSGVSLAGHRSVTITRDDLDWADVVVVMDRHNWSRLVELGADEHKLLWAGVLAGEEPEIPDPYGHDEHMARSVIARLARCGDALVAEIERRSASR